MYLVMELCDAGGLDSLLKDKTTFSEAVSLQILVEIIKKICL